ncbi:hypothetical protein WN55_07190 [Dufourea novaeangliae]|uniref:Uncharacterized protein n=1 Tax=Dufourea novaeangliae TaxID=178035 RepID=A0A154PS48_DUFNO|nr:hypothetical protein WN55_07190 [Dufourea novaeangliae]
MAHALRRISYATCEPQHAQFSFLAREPRAHFSIQYCHSFITESAQQAALAMLSIRESVIIASSNNDTIVENEDIREVKNGIIDECLVHNAKHIRRNKSSVWKHFERLNRAQGDYNQQKALVPLAIIASISKRTYTDLDIHIITFQRGCCLHKPSRDELKASSCCLKDFAAGLRLQCPWQKGKEGYRFFFFWITQEWQQQLLWMRAWKKRLNPTMPLKGSRNRYVKRRLKVQVDKASQLSKPLEEASQSSGTATFCRMPSRVEAFDYSPRSSCRQEVKERESQTHAIGALLALSLSLSLQRVSCSLAGSERDKENRQMQEETRNEIAGIRQLPLNVFNAAVGARKRSGEKRSVGRSVAPLRSVSRWGGDRSRVGCRCYSRFVFLFRLQFLSTRTGEVLPLPSWAKHALGPPCSFDRCTTWDRAPVTEEYACRLTESHSFQLTEKITKIWRKPRAVRFESSWKTKRCNGRRGMRRFTRRRKTLAAFSAIMGRLGKGSQSTTRPIFRVQYRKLVDEYSQQQEQLKFMPALPDYMSYCCCRCGHTQKLKALTANNLAIYSPYSLLIPDPIIVRSDNLERQMPASVDHEAKLR